MLNILYYYTIFIVSFVFRFQHITYLLHDAESFLRS